MCTKKKYILWYEKYTMIKSLIFLKAKKMLEETRAFLLM